MSSILCVTPHQYELLQLPASKEYYSLQSLLQHQGYQRGSNRVTHLDCDSAEHSPPLSFITKCRNIFENGRAALWRGPFKFSLDSLDGLYLVFMINRVIFRELKLFDLKWTIHNLLIQILAQILTVVSYIIIEA